MKTKMIIKPLKLKKMGNNENGRVDAMDTIAENIQKTVKTAKDNKINIILICVFENEQKKGVSIVRGGMSEKRAFIELSRAIADEFAETISEL